MADVIGGLAVHPGRTSPSVAPHPLPGVHKNSGVVDEVVEVVEPTIRSRRSPTGAAWSGSSVPARPHRHPATERRCSPSTSRRSSADTAITLSPFAMYVAFPRSDYYEDSAPIPGSSADDEPARRRPGWARGGRPGRFPRSLLTVRPVRRPAFPLQHRHEYAADFRRGLPAGPVNRLRSRPRRQTTRGVHCCPAHIHQVRAGSGLEGVLPLVPSLVHLPVLLAGPGPSGSAGPSRRCRGGSHPSLRLQGQAAPCFHQACCDGPKEWSVHPHSVSRRLVAHVGSDQGAVPVSQPVRLPGPPSEPDMRVSTHPALHMAVPSNYAADSFVAHGEGMRFAR